MKKIINRKVYDTEAATCVATYSFSSRNDFHYFSETLYRTGKGAFFLAGLGGPLSQYAISSGSNTTQGSEDITPLTPDDAMNWLEAHNFPEEIERYFQDKIEEA